MSIARPTTQSDRSVLGYANREFSILLSLARFGSRTCIAALLFGAKGLSFLNSKVEATRVLLEQDGFEWRHPPFLCQSRIVLVRDVLKTC